MQTKNQSATLSDSTVLPLNLSAAQSNLLHKIILNLLQPVQQWLDAIEIHNRNFARLIFKLIPDQCPFERDLKLFGYKIAHIPPLCKLNPLYEQLVGLRFRALCYLVDQCGEIR